MKHGDFSIGLEFSCGSRRWRCTDVGSRVVVAICLEPRWNGNSEKCGFSSDPRDLNGPPYSVAEVVFDEYDLDACTLLPGD